MAQTSLGGAAEGTHLRRRVDGLGAQVADLYTLVWARALKTKVRRV